MKYPKSSKWQLTRGFRKEEGWSSFTSEKPVVIVKLKEVAEEIGLKSPS